MVTNRIRKKDTAVWTAYLENFPFQKFHICSFSLVHNKTPGCSSIFYIQGSFVYCLLLLGLFSLLYPFHIFRRWSLPYCLAAFQPPAGFPLCKLPLTFFTRVESEDSGRIHLAMCSISCCGMPVLLMSFFHLPKFNRNEMNPSQRLLFQWLHHTRWWLLP